MDYLDQHIAILKKDEQKIFAKHLEKSSKLDYRFRLFNLLTDGVERTPQEIIRKLYEKSELAPADLINAYHGVRKRLMASIFKFIQTHNMPDENQDHSKMVATLKTCEVFIHRENYALAQHYLKKAETTAQTNRQYDMLDKCYNFQLKHCRELQLPIDVVMRKSAQNVRQLDIQRKLNFAEAMIDNTLEELRANGKTLHPDAVTKHVLEKLDLRESDTFEPTFQFRILTIYRSAMISVKEYFDLENYIQKIYSTLEANNCFTKIDDQVKEGFLFFLAHAQYRNRNFVTAYNTLNIAESFLTKSLFKTSPYYLKMISLRTAIAANGGNNKLALELMEEHITEIRKQPDSREKLNMILNYCVYLFNADNFKMASTIMREIDECLRNSKIKMGKEWVFKKRMIHLIVRIEMGSLDEGDKMIKAIKEDYKDFFKDPLYSRAGIFLGFIEEYLKDPIKVSDPAFIARVRSSGLAWPGHKEDIQAITFFCWLLSKMMKRPYYEVLMERMSEGVPKEEVFATVSK